MHASAQPETNPSAATWPVHALQCCKHAVMHMRSQTPDPRQYVLTCDRQMMTEAPEMKPEMVGWDMKRVRMTPRPSTPEAVYSTATRKASWMTFWLYISCRGISASVGWLGLLMPLASACGVLQAGARCQRSVQLLLAICTKMQASSSFA
jgi:hypothetical protein